MLLEHISFEMQHNAVCEVLERDTSTQLLCGKWHMINEVSDVRFWENFFNVQCFLAVLVASSDL